MTLQPITRHGRTVATATAQRFFLCDELARRPADDPEVTWVAYMCRCAADIAAGELPGPYTDESARAYARAALIPTEVLERPAPAGNHRLAAGLQVPLDELLAARAEHTATAAR